MCDNVSLSVGVEGNTNPQLKKKKCFPSIKWCFTYNNYTKENEKLICAIIQQYCRYGCFSREIAPETGTPHLQGYIEFKRRHRPTEKFKIYNNEGKLCIHWEKAKANREKNKLYCLKYGAQQLHFEHPPKYNIKIENFYPWQEDIKLLLNQEPDDRTINWFWESSGCAGKTTFQKWVYCHFDNVVVLGGKGADMKNGIVQYYDKNQTLPKIVLINIPRCQEHVSYGGIEQVKDMFFYSGKYEGGMICGKNPHVIVFANTPPKGYDKMSEDRWNIVNIKNVKKSKDIMPPIKVVDEISFESSSEDEQDSPVNVFTLKFD